MMKYEIVCGHWTVHADGVKTVLYVGKDEKGLIQPRRRRFRQLSSSGCSVSARVFPLRQTLRRL